MDAGEEVEFGEFFVGAVVRPVGEEAEFLAGLEPISDLFNSGLL